MGPLAKWKRPIRRGLRAYGLMARALRAGRRGVHRRPRDMSFAATHAGKRARLGTRNKVKHRSLDQYARIGHGETRSFVTYGPIRGKPALLAKASKNSLYTDSVSTSRGGYFETTAGRQGYFQLDNCSVSALQGTYNVLNTAYPANNQYPLNTTTLKWYLEEYNSEVMLTNSSTAASRVDLYTWVPRHDITLSSPDLLVAAGMTATTQNNVAGVETYVGATPFEVPKITTLYKCVKVTHLILEAGSTHVHRTKLRLNHFIDYTRLFESGMNYLQGLSILTTGRVYGTPVIDGQSIPSVTTSANKILYTVKHRITFTYLPSVQVTNAASTSLANTQSATFLNPETDESATLGVV